MKLLLAEDDIKLGALVKSLLEFSGFETEWARDGREALERIREAAASSYDVVILDWMLPEISGIEICRLLRNPRKYNYQGGIIFLTARDGTDDCVTGLESGADDYLVKPFAFEELLALPGVGRKSANLIMGDVFCKPAIVTDTHCIRLCNKIGLVDGIKEPQKVEMALWKIIPPEEGSDLCHRFVMHGRAVCNARKPECEKCCLKDICRTAREAAGQQAEP